MSRCDVLVVDAHGWTRQCKATARYRLTRRETARYTGGFLTAQDLCALHARPIFERSALPTNILCSDDLRHPEDGTWLPGSGEEPFLREGRRIQRVFQPATGRHGWLDMATDIVTPD